MIHIDEKFKDDSPVKTVDRIIKLLHENNIEAEEKWNDSGIENCHSVRVSIRGTTMFSYGKGVTRELARASGYAELMERLQSGYLCFGKLEYPDAKKMTRSELSEQSGKWLSMMADSVAGSEKTSFSAEKLLDNVFAYGDDTTTDVIPYYNANDGSLVYLPANLISRLYSSNGLAAGNSREEALVQGFSEVVERYCHCRIIRESIVPPTVPDAYLEQFSTAYRIISAMRDAGYQVIIKDCSLGEGYPVIASVVIDRKRHGYRVNVGSSPVFEIALERCLTEIMQGRNISTLQMINTFASKNNRSAVDVMLSLTTGNGAYPLDFFEGEPSYPFAPFPDRSGENNKALLRYIMGYLAKHNRTMLIRDLSHFGFHTYRIIVPGISEVFGFSFTGEPSLLRMGYETKDIRKNPKAGTREQMQIYSLLYQTTPRGSQGPLSLTAHTSIPLSISPKEDTFYGLLGAAYAEWGLSNLPKAYKYALSAAQYAPEEKKELMSAFDTYLYQRLIGFSSEDILQKLELFYDPPVIESISDLVKNYDNPFEGLLPMCDERCEICSWAEHCTQNQKSYVLKQLNKAVARFDAIGSFEAMKRTFSSIG